jgi:hypothetical protein
MKTSVNKAAPEEPLGVQNVRRTSFSVNSPPLLKASQLSAFLGFLCVSKVESQSGFGPQLSEFRPGRAVFISGLRRGRSKA